MLYDRVKLFKESHIVLLGRAAGLAAINHESIADLFANHRKLWCGIDWVV